MLVDKMDYQKQQQQQGGGGGLQDDAFYDLLSSTAMANAKHQQQHHSQQQQSPDQQQHHPQFEQQAFDSRNDEPLLPSYDFQQSNSSSYGGSVVSNGEEKTPGMAPVVSSYSSGSPFQGSRQHLPIPSFVENPPARQERGNSSSSAEAATVAAVEQTMKKYMDSMLIMMESVTGRIGQLESSTRRLEQLVTEFRGGAEKNQGAAGGKLLLIETMLSEVQRGIQDLRTKQEAAETQANMRKLLLSEEGNSASAGHNQPSLEPPPPPSPRAPQLPETPSYPPHHPHHPHHPPPPPYMVPPQLVGLAPPPPPPPAGHPESHYPPQQQVGPPPPPPPPQQQQGAPPPPQQQFYGQQQQQQPQQQQQQQGPPPPPPPPPHSHAFAPHPNELALYGGSPQGPYKGQSGQFAQEVPPPYGNRPQQGPPPPTGPPMYDQSGMLPSYQSQGRPQAPVYEQQRQEQQMGGPPPGYSNPGYRTGQQAPSAPSSGAGGYPRLPSSQPVQHAMPTGRDREGQAAPSGTTPLSTNRLSVDEVIDKVAVMGFSKDQVRAVVRRLTENGQSVDLNIVLDKLMNGEAGPNQPKSWFQRG